MFSNNIVMSLIDGMFFCITFIDLVALIYEFWRSTLKENLVFIMGALTSAYGVGQIIAPLYSVALIEQFQTYNHALYLTAFIVACGILLLTYAKFNFKEAKQCMQ